MVIRILDFVSACDTNAQGDIVRKVILSRLKSNDIISLDFVGVPNVTSSFVNCALVSLLPDFNLKTIKARIQIKRVNRQIGNMIKDRMASENRAAA
jgi:hypothetical protein